MDTRHDGSLVTLHAASSRCSAPAVRRQVEDELAQILHRPPAVELTPSCTDAIEIAASVLDLGPDDEVIVPAFSFPSTANPFVLRGSRIRFADADPLTGNVTASSVAARGSRATAAVVCMHYGGVACEMDALLELCTDRGWPLVEDAAHGLFASYDGTPLGRFGALGALSFHRTKNISAGEGGALVVNDDRLRPAATIALDKGTDRAAFERGAVDAYQWSGPGSSWRMSDVHVAMLDEQLSRREAIQTRRHEVWSAYAARLREWSAQHDVLLPHVAARASHPAHLFWLKLPDEHARGALVDRCARAGIEVAQHYGSLASSRFGSSLSAGDDCPEAEQLGRRLVRLPLHHELTDDDVDRVIAAVTSTAP